MFSPNPNLGTADRTFRAVTAVAMLIATFTIALPLMAVLGLALTGLYMMGTSLVGTCLGYKLIGVSTCPIKQQRSI